MQWVVDVLRKHSLFAKLQKCRFYKDEVCFLGYVFSSQGIKIEDKKIEAIKNSPKPKSIRYIQIFLGFANFYHCFIWDFSKIAIPLTLMLKIFSFLSKIQLDKIANGVNDKVVEDGNRSGGTTFISKKLKNAVQKFVCMEFRSYGKINFSNPQY